MSTYLHRADFRLIIEDGSLVTAAEWWEDCWSLSQYGLDFGIWIWMRLLEFEWVCLNFWNSVLWICLRFWDIVVRIRYVNLGCVILIRDDDLWFSGLLWGVTMVWYCDALLPYCSPCREDISWCDCTPVRYAYCGCLVSHSIDRKAGRMLIVLCMIYQVRWRLQV